MEHRFFIEEPKDITIIKEKETLKHIKVLRLKEKDKIIILDGKCGRFKGEIEKIGKEECIVKITKKEKLKPPPIEITLIQGIPKHPKMDLIVEMLGGFSIKRIIPLIAKRSIPKKENIERLRNIAKSSFLTSGSYLLCSISNCLSLDRAIEEIKGDDLIIVPWEEEKKTHFKPVLASHKSSKKISVFIGPEGGFDKEEIESIQKIGGISVSLGDAIIKTEYAGFFVISSILYEFSPYNLKYGIRGSGK
ncbi:MAG: RsmE family RNA methyltransferase [bacterium]